MGIKTKKRVSLLITAFISTLLFASPAFAAALTGHLDTVDSTHITGWAWNKDDSDEVISVELHIYADGNPKEITAVTVTADEWRDDLHTLLDDGYHSFQYEVDWSALKGTTFEVKAFALSGEERIPLIGASTYTKKDRDAQSGPGIKNTTAATANPAGGTKGDSLGIFMTTGYCNCSKCSGGHGLTYSGTVPKANHTISADLDVLPLGSRVMIDGIIYTVEDIGSSVDGKKIDIYYDTHSEAWDHGMVEKEVFLVK